MKLRTVQVKSFRNFIDSGDVAICDDVTCLVGKNESGKTAFLQSLYRIKPARPNVAYSAPDHYPAWLEKRDRMRGQKLDDVQFVKATFEFDPIDIAAVEKTFGKGVLKSKCVNISRDYKGKAWYAISIDESAAVRNIVQGVSLPAEIASAASKIVTVEQLRSYVASLSATEEEKLACAALTARLNEVVPDGNCSSAVWEVLDERVPAFFYYSEYANLPYSVKIRELLESDEKNLNDEQLTARALLRLAAADQEYLLNPDYERRKRELENVANALTQDVLKYWSQNPELRVQPDITLTTMQNHRGQQSVVDELKTRIWDQRHSLSLPFDEHSTGFRWFFSFLAAFSEYEYKETPVIILLDEPALGLHARAQADFLRFIDERLAPRCQVVYTTHSPFMVQPGKLERARIVIDQGQEKGATVSEDIFTTDPDTLFPLQGALGYDIAQHLFIAPHNLVVEGTSDYTYLTVVSDYLRQNGKAGLDERWSIVPVGGADMVPTFVALLGQHLEVTVVVDAQKAGHQKLSHLAAQGYLPKKRIITIGEVLGRKLADVEDLFAPDDYLALYNAAFGTALRPGDIKGTDQILNRIARHQKVDRFDHGRPADALLRHRDEFRSKLSPTSLENFEKLFLRINATLGKRM